MEGKSTVIAAVSTPGWQDGIKLLVNQGGELLLTGNPSYLSTLERAISSGSLAQTLRVVLLGGEGALPYPGVKPDALSKLLSLPLFTEKPQSISRVVALLVSGALLGSGGVAGTVAGVVELFKREVEVRAAGLNGNGGLILRLLK